jgi:hypothetical protein
MSVAGGSPEATVPGLIAMWAAPRSRSTAFFRYMLEHGGLVALHEPFDNIADHGSTTVNGHPVSDPVELITTMRGLAGTATVFFKETTDRRHHAVLADRRFLTEVTHTFLIRAPPEIAASCYALQGERLSLSEIGLEHAYDLYQAVLAAGGNHDGQQRDAGTLQRSPRALLPRASRLQDRNLLANARRPQRRQRATLCRGH